MPMFGISTYLQDMEEDYVKNAAKYGASYIFTSLHIPEEDLSNAPLQIAKLLEYCQIYQMEFVPDVSPVTFEKLNIQHGDFKALKALGIDNIRLDYGFDDIQLIKTLQQDFKIMLNASTLHRAYLQDCKKQGIDLHNIIVVHNFYPKPDTGLSRIFFKELNTLFQEFDLQVLSFVVGDHLKRFPLYCGLPTIEAHRDVHPYVACVEQVVSLQSTGVIIGDSMAQINTLKYIHLFLHEHILTIPVHLHEQYTYLYEQDLRVRKDRSETCIRLNTPRSSAIRPCNNGPRKKGYILLINELGQRYCGELQICKQDLAFAVDANMIGYVDPQFIDLLEWITNDYTIRFERIVS